MWRIKAIAWRLAFAGRLMERTTWGFKRSYLAAQKHQRVNSDWNTKHPKQAADRHYDLFVPKSERTAWGKRHERTT